MSPTPPFPPAPVPGSATLPPVDLVLVEVLVAHPNGYLETRVACAGDPLTDVPGGTRILASRFF